MIHLYFGDPKKYEADNDFITTYTEKEQYCSKPEHLEENEIIYVLEESKGLQEILDKYQKHEQMLEDLLFLQNYVNNCKKCTPKDFKF